MREATSSGHAGQVLEQRLVALDEIIHLVDVQEAVAGHARHAGVDLGHDERGARDGRLDDVDADAEVQVAVAVGQRRLDERHVDVDVAAVEEIRDLRQEDRRVVGQARG